MNILFICSRNKWRSATAETIFKNHPEHQVKSAGTSPSARVKLNASLLEWADLVFVMEKRHRQIIREKFYALDNIPEMIVLHIPDEYQYMDEELIEELNVKVSSYLQNHD